MTINKGVEAMLRRKKSIRPNFRVSSSKALKIFNTELGFSFDLCFFYRKSQRE